MSINKRERTMRVESLKILLDNVKSGLDNRKLLLEKCGSVSHAWVQYAIEYELLKDNFPKPGDHNLRYLEITEKGKAFLEIFKKQVIK